METGEFFKQMRLVGGDLALDFVNTQAGPPDGPPDSDALDGYKDLLVWSHLVGTMVDQQKAALALAAHAHPAAAASAFRRSIRVRSYLGEIFRALARQQEPSTSLTDLLRDDWADALRYAALVRSGQGYAWDWAGCDDLSAPLWPVVQASVELLRSGPVTRVKHCGACRFLFVDRTKNGSRRWCTMEDCGKAAKMRRYVARRSASRASARGTL